MKKCELCGTPDDVQVLRNGAMVCRTCRAALAEVHMPDTRATALQDDTTP